MAPRPAAPARRPDKGSRVTTDQEQEAAEDDLGRIRAGPLGSCEVARRVPYRRQTGWSYRAGLPAGFRG